MLGVVTFQSYYCFRRELGLGIGDDVAQAPALDPKLLEEVVLLLAPYCLLFILTRSGRARAASSGPPLLPHRPGFGAGACLLRPAGLRPRVGGRATSPAAFAGRGDQSCRRAFPQLHSTGGSPSRGPGPFGLSPRDRRPPRTPTPADLPPLRRLSWRQYYP